MESVTSQPWALNWSPWRRLSEQTSPAQDRTHHHHHHHDTHTHTHITIYNGYTLLLFRENTTKREIFINFYFCIYFEGGKGCYLFDFCQISLSKMASLSSCLFPLLLLITMVTEVMSQPLSKRPDSQILQDLFGSQITSLLLSQPEITEGSAQSPAPTERDRRGLSGGIVMKEPQGLVSHPVLNFLLRHRKLRVRNRKSSARGCFGIKVDRIGALSGLGC
ncbi:C-type natriuretic peptide 2-like [Silurus meridionalis]|nr:C-type natriuretic peptide 2-like [Silurus meridionalis]